MYSHDFDDLQFLVIHSFSTYCRFHSVAQLVEMQLTLYHNKITYADNIHCQDSDMLCSKHQYGVLRCLGASVG